MKKTIYFLIFIISSYTVRSQDIRSATLIITDSSALKFGGDLNLYVDSAMNVNRPFVLLNWGLAVDTLFLYNQSQLPGSILKKEYSGHFTYLSPGTYHITYQDSYRVPGILNISNSQMESVKIGRELIINPFLGLNNSATINETLTMSGNYYYLHPNAVDVDNDSLYYTLTSCFASSYSLPDSISIDNTSGVVQFRPEVIGKYSICYKIEEWREFAGSYYYYGFSTHDLLLDIDEITSITETTEVMNQLSLYPNPTQSTLALQLSEATKEELKIEIKNMLGQTLQSLQLPAGNKQLDMDVSRLVKGIYFVQCQNKDITISKKFVKQ